MDEIKKLISSLLISCPFKMDIKKLERDYFEQIGEKIPCSKFGFRSSEDFLRSMPDILRINGSGPYAEIEVVINEKVTHIDKLISQQKLPSSNKQHFGNRFFQNRRRLTIKDQNFVKSIPVAKEDFRLNTSTPCPTRLVNTKDITNFESKSSSSEKATSFKKESCSDLSFSRTSLSLSPIIDRGSTSSVCDIRNQSTITDLDENLQHPNDSDNESEYATCIPDDVQEELKNLIDKYDDGIWCASMPNIYKNLYKKSLDYSQYGYKSLIQMCLDLEKIFNCHRPSKGDYKLYSRLNGPKYFCQGLTKPKPPMIAETRQSACSKEVALKDVEDLIDFNSNPYPLNVVTLSQQIPKQFLQDHIKERDYIELCVAEVYDPSKFWIILRESYNELQILMDKLQNFYSLPETLDFYKISNNQVKIGLYCSTKYQGDFHRAIIVCLIPGCRGKVKVYFFDFGTICTQDIKELYFLHTQFSHIPQLAIRARLSGIFPRTSRKMWSDEASSRFLELVQDTFLVAELSYIDKTENIVEIILADTSGEDDIFINDTLVNEGHAVFTMEQQEENPLMGNYASVMDHIFLLPTFDEIEQGTVLDVENIAISGTSHPTQIPSTPRIGAPPGLENVRPQPIFDNNDKLPMPCNSSSYNDNYSYSSNHVPQDQPAFYTPQMLPNRHPLLLLQLPVQYNPSYMYPRLIPYDYYSNFSHPHTYNQPSFNPFRNFTPNCNCSQTNQQYQNTALPRKHLQDIVKQKLLQRDEFTLHRLNQILQRECGQAYEQNDVLFKAFALTYEQIFGKDFETFNRILDAISYENMLELSRTALECPGRTTNYNVATAEINMLNTSTASLNSTSYDEIERQIELEVAEICSRSSTLEEPATINSKNSSNLDTDNFENNDQSESIIASKSKISKNGQQEEDKNKLIIQTELNNRLINVIRLEDDNYYVIVHEITQFTEQNFSLENIRKLILMRNPTMSTLDIRLSEHERLAEEMSKNGFVDKNCILHLIPVTYLQKFMEIIGYKDLFSSIFIDFVEKFSNA